MIMKLNSMKLYCPLRSVCLVVKTKIIGLLSLFKNTKPAIEDLYLLLKICHPQNYVVHLNYKLGWK